VDDVVTSELHPVCSSSSLRSDAMLDSAASSSMPDTNNAVSCEGTPAARALPTAADSAKEVSHADGAVTVHERRHHSGNLSVVSEDDGLQSLHSRGNGEFYLMHFLSDFTPTLEILLCIVTDFCGTNCNTWRCPGN